ncbi:hypothetical protein GZ982_30160 (plasmid) [Pseudomonas fluorescens]|nr:hypothetical protein GZ982_30160 [Pseudomonas fluorescens]
MTESLPTEKARRLADWQDQLERPPAGPLDTWHADLRGEVDQLKADGLVDPLEAHDMRELADAAYSHHLEEAITRELNQSGV